MEKSFVQFSKSHYANDVRPTMAENFVDDIHITIGEDVDLTIEWVNIEKNSLPFCQIKMFDDCWGIFKTCPELFQKLSKLKNTSPQPKDIIKVLKSLGFKDKSPTKKKQ